MIHDNIAKMLHWKLCEKLGFNKAENWYIHKREKVLESENCKVLWNFPIETDKTLENNEPDINVFDPACPFDTRIEKKEKEKCSNYRS